MAVRAVGDRLRPLGAATEVAVAAVGVCKAYGPAGNHVLALDRLSLEVRRGEFVCLVGASGCGKSTFLNLVAGLDAPSTGTVTIPGGRTGLLFQDAALFPWLTVERNVQLALQLRGVKRVVRRQLAQELIDLVHLAGFEQKRPHELSGGMRQRVALARALAQDAEMLLMDEPFGALDAITRDLMHDEVERIVQQTGVTVLLVTHNVREAVRLGDRIAVLSSRPGRVVAEFTNDHPRPRHSESPDVARMTADITARLREEVRRHAGDAQH